MTAIKQQWSDGAGPNYSGLFFGDNTYRTALLNREEQTLEIGNIAAIPLEMDFSDYGDYESGRLKCNAGVLRWGGGPWEAEGWIALEDYESNLIWLLHLEDSEAFTQARCEGLIIEAVAYQYPVMNVFSIPAKDPHLAAVGQEADVT
ncbi:hypothetical protein [Roseibacillus persicicus]|uniref:hypothetical protein n=1 Tax=Roseibacillus persicicus TaxID=454148 RepID=UPI0028101AD6|nr:hypothetical protein [Roseibacillus persicicus]MDQ8192677.1 hypothetical protein [Roseibacillus persicicus]